MTSWKSPSALVMMLLAGACATSSISEPAPGPVAAVTEGYVAEQADQFQWPVLNDITPQAPAARSAYVAALAQLATIYGSLPVEQYKQMHAQAIDVNDPDYTGFNAFDYDENLAAPGYRDFKTPNVDTLYFNAWLDLTNGPVLIDVPATDGRFYTLNFVDVYGNATNISTRTKGSAGGSYLVAPVGWSGDVPQGASLFRVTSPYQWILGRVFTSGGDDLETARAYQKAFTITSLAAPAETAVAFPSPTVSGPADFLRILDFIVDQNGYPVQETALINQFRPLGVGGDISVADAMADEATAAGILDGYAEGWQVITASFGQGGSQAGTWRVPTDIGRFGTNYLSRSGIIRATGANVIDEYYPFATYFDGDGDTLDGSMHAYEVTLPSEPQVAYFWSLIPYSSATAELHPNILDKYEIGDRTEGLVYNDDGSLTLRIQHEQPDDVPVANWLPVPNGPFYLLMRNQGAAPEFYSGDWIPGPVIKVEP